MKPVFLLMFLSVFLSACGSTFTTAPQTDEVPPTPYPDTPSPAEINALRVDSPALIDLDMFNELDGWAVTEAEIVRTNDGGLTWYDVSPPGLDETGYSVDTYVLDNDHAWVLKPDFENFPPSGNLYRTADGGRTWSSYTVPYSRADIHFMDADSGWALADLGVGAGSNAVAVYRTTNGGATWERTYTNDPNDTDASGSLPLGGLKSDLVPLDMDTAWVTGVVYAPGEPYFYRTDDGGRSWTPVIVELPSGAEGFELGIREDQMKFVSAADGFIAIHMAGDTLQTAVYVTGDAGNTWRLTPTVIDGAGSSVFISPQEAVMYSRGQFHVTRDAAQTWSTVFPDVSFEDTFLNMDFVNLLAGWVITMDPSTNHRSLYRTLDGGSTWLPIVP